MDELSRLKNALTSANCVAYECNLDSGLLSWTGDIQTMLSIDSIEHVSSHKKYTLLIHENDRDPYNAALTQSISDNSPFYHTYRLNISDGNSIYIEDNAIISDNGQEKVIVGMLKLLPEENSHTQHLDINRHDNANFIAAFEEMIAQARNECNQGCFLKISINNLPTLMTWHGDEISNRVMEEIRSNISKFVSEDDVVEHVAIDQLGVLVGNTNNDAIQQIVNKIHHYIKHFKSTEFDEPLRLETSIGSVYFPADDCRVDDFFRRAYIALSNAKGAKSGFYSDFSDAETEQQFSKEQINIMYYMKDAVHQDKFCLAYQPIVESKTGKVASYECLLRIKDDEGNASTAWPVIHVAEKTGFIDVVDHFVLEKVVEDIKAYKDIELTFNVSNITTDSPKWLASCTKYFSDPNIASRVTIEITETAAERDLKQTAYFVASLQALGCKVALDDFGAGYTSFRQLKSLSVDMVKIDGMFILDLAENSENLLFIKTLLDFNNCYGLQTIAECVESGEVAKLLMDMDVEYMQGYYFGVPTVDRPWLDGDSKNLTAAPSYL